MTPSSVWTSLTYATGHLPPWLSALLVFAVIVAAGLVLQAVIVRLAQARSERWHPLVRLVFERGRTVMRFTIFMIAVAIALPLVPLSPSAQDAAHKILVAAIILLIGWNVLVGVDIATDRYLAGLRLDIADNLTARKAATQMRILGRTAKAFVTIVTIGIALMSFNAVRQFGVSIFASAGVAGIVAGLAARPLLSNLIAGFQLALTQPIRVDDAVVIDNEWGRVEEFTSTYVVIRLWDWRRQIVPLSYFFENVFTNWTRSSSSIIGTVFLYLDYTIPVARIREKAEEFAKASKLWDGQIVNVQVSDAKEQTIEVRVLASAVDSSKAWDLRCEMREKLIGFVQQEFPESLPRRRSDAKFAGPVRVTLGETEPARRVANR